MYRSARMLMFLSCLLCSPLVTGHEFGQNTPLQEKSGALSNTNPKQVAEAFYPKNKTAAKTLEWTLRLAYKHRGKGVFCSLNGPETSDFGINSVPIAFVNEGKDGKSQLLLINFSNLPEKAHKEWSKSAGIPVYVIEVPTAILPKEKKKADEEDEKGKKRVSLFTAAMGPGFPKKLFRGFNLDDADLDLIKDEPVASGLGEQMGAILNPRAWFDGEDENGQFAQLISYVYFHELHHLHLFNCKARRSESLLRGEKEKREKIFEDFTSSEGPKLLVAYRHLVFQIAHALKKGKRHNKNLRRLATVVKKLKKDHNDFWREFIVSEYHEGFAHYASYQSLLDLDVIDFKEAMDGLREDDSNPFLYATGGIGGFYLREKLKGFNWKGKATDSKLGVWDRILTQLEVQPAGEKKLQRVFDEIGDKSTIDRLVHEVTSYLRDIP